MLQIAAVALVTVLAATISGEASSGVEASSDEFFEKHIRPVLVESCFRCHGGQKTSGNLRIDSRDALLTGGDSGPAIDLENPGESLLLLAVRRSEEVSAMPPDKPLDDKEVANLQAWIQSGAYWPKQTAGFQAEGHWAFEPIEAPAVPEVTRKHWAKSPIDHFILQQIEAEGKQPSPLADKRTLLRRATYDLTGLPPTPDELARFELDNSADAFERVVDRLLASPRYGEHWGRHWLDLVRYADTAGENTDHPLPHAWRYRNWVINSMNADLPFDEFVRHQIAGDLLADGDSEADYSSRVVATGYLAIARRFGHNIDKDIHLTHEDIIDNLGKTFLGLTLGCCRCHDHKYDPLTARDYYGLYGILESTRISFPGCEPNQQPRDLVPLLSPGQIEMLRQPIDIELAAIDEAYQQLQREQEPLQRQLADRSSVLVLSEGALDDGSETLLSAADAQVSAEHSLQDRFDIDVRQGEVIQLSISPLGNHGADSTSVAMEITAEDRGLCWSLSDLLQDLLTDNPHPDRYGNAGIWCFLDAQDGLAFLPEVASQLSGRPELQAWRNGEIPSVFVNTSELPIDVWTKLPPRTFFVHPGLRSPVTVAWISPIDGHVTLHCRIADAHPGGDGVGWKLEHRAVSGDGAAMLSLGRSRKRLAELNQRRSELQAQRDNVPVAFAAAEGNPKNARIQVRGEPTDLGEEVPRKFLDILGGQSVADQSTSGRRELASWITDPANPLFARVIVNRVWQWHFGRGLVATPNDFGMRGSAPTHPALLDYLATDFIQSGWSLKALHRKILLSATWQQLSTNAERPELYSSFQRRRLTAEELRDTLLFASGELDLVPGSSHPFPPESTWSFTQHNPFAAQYESNKRSVYLMQKRNRRDRFFALFDGPDPNASTPVREVTTVPTQALFFLNDEGLHLCAEKLTRRILASNESDDRRLDFALLLLVGRRPSTAERVELREFLKEYTGLEADEPTKDATSTSWNALSRILLSSNEVLYVD